MNKKIESNGAPKAIGVYSQAVKNGDLIFTSGQICLTKEGKMLNGTIEEQTHQIMKNLEAILNAAGAVFGDVVKTTIYITDMSIFGKVNEIYGSYFSEPFPAREISCVKELPLGAKIEISMVAAKPGVN